MKNIIFITGILIILSAGFVILNSNNEKVNIEYGKNEKLEGAQEFVLSIKDLNYFPQEIRVKEGSNVSIILDKSVQGCFRYFTIKDLGISKYSSKPEDSIEFTANKKGTFVFACSMGMGTGKIIVE